MRAKGGAARNLPDSPAAVGDPSPPRSTVGRGRPDGPTDAAHSLRPVLLTERSVPRWWYLLRYHRPSQLVRRGLSTLHRRLAPLLPQVRDEPTDGSQVVRRDNAGFEQLVARHLRLRTARGDVRDKAAALLEGEFEFLNERRTLPRPIDWTLSSVAPVSHLWRFHLHYHEFLLDLLAADRQDGGTDASAPAWEFVDEWIRANPLERSVSLNDAWHPFCLSKRIAVWLMLWCTSQPPVELQDRFSVSLERQLRFLERHLEWDLRGNHLLENLRTLVLAGAFLSGRAADARLDWAATLFERQLAEQILPGGEHFERSPMYHAQMLCAVLDVRDALQPLRPELAQTCTSVAGRMGDLLNAIVHPDGEVPLLSDTALGETPNVSIVLENIAPSRTAPARTVESSEARLTGDYWCWRSGTDFLLFDTGPVGADELPAHAHCDLLSFEASFSGQRVFVDSGVFDYSDGPMRRSCRSTAAHNALEIDGIDQCDTWSRFRMGYRGHPSRPECGWVDEFAWCRATHNAYRRLGVPQVGRWLACRPNGPWLCVDWAAGAGRHTLVDRLHLFPDVQIAVENADRVRLAIGERRLVVRSLTGDAITVGSGWYCPDFGVRQEARVLEVHRDVQLPALMGWIVENADADSQVSLAALPTGGVQLHWRTRNREVTLAPVESVGAAPMNLGQSASTNSEFTNAR